MTTHELVQSAFLWALATLGNPAPCAMPHVVFDSDAIVALCQPQARAGNVAAACYLPDVQIIVLRSEWDDTGDDWDLLRYEMLRHTTEVCLRKPFNVGGEDYRKVLQRFEE